MNRLAWIAIAMLTLAGVGIGGCKSQPGSSVESAPAQQTQTFAESMRHSDRREEGNRPRRGGPAANDTPSAFDYYLLTLSWSPEFCYSHPDATECAAHPAFVLHGLWPQNDDGSYPEHCSDAPGPANESAFADILPDAHLLEHEWQTHGTCSGLRPQAYFSAARQAMHLVKIPAELALVPSEVQLTPQQILGDFAKANPGLPQDSLVMSCANNRLTAVEVCLDKNLHAMSCPAVRSCRANVVKVTPQGATRQ